MSSGVEGGGRPPCRRVVRWYEGDGEQPTAVRLADQQHALGFAARVADEDAAVPQKLINLSAAHAVASHLRPVMAIDDQVGNEMTSHASDLVDANLENR
jgi:hypothetical protein